MRRICLVAVVPLCALVVAAPALALPHLSKAQNRDVSTFVARWVHDMVERRTLADGWKIAGPAMRGVVSRQEWVSGRQVPVHKFEILNDPRTAWYAKWRSDGELGLVLSLRTGHGKNAEMLQEEMVLAKRHGSWIVNSFYTDGIFRLGKGHSGSCVSSKCRVTGIADYQPGSGGGFASARPHIPLRTAVIVVLSVAGLVVLTGLGILLRHRRRYRRALASYHASR